MTFSNNPRTLPVEQLVDKENRSKNSDSWYQNTHYEMNGTIYLKKSATDPH